MRLKVYEVRQMRLLMWLTVIIVSQLAWHHGICEVSHAVELSQRGQLGFLWLMGIVPILFLSVCVSLLIEVLVSLFADRK